MPKVLLGIVLAACVLFAATAASEAQGKSKDRIRADKEAARIKAEHILRNEKIKADRAARDAIVQQEKKARQAFEKAKRKGKLPPSVTGFKPAPDKKVNLPTPVGSDVAEQPGLSPEEKERQALIEAQREKLPDNLTAEERALLSPEEKPYLTDRERQDLSPASQAYIERREQGAPKEGHVELPQAVSWENVAEIAAQYEAEQYEKLSPEVQRFVDTAKAYQEGKVTLDDLKASASPNPEIISAFTPQEVRDLTEAIEGGEGAKELARERQQAASLPGLQWGEGATPEAQEALAEVTREMDYSAVPLDQWGIELPEDIRQIALEEKRKAGLVKNGRVYLGDHTDLPDERISHNYWQRVKVIEEMDAYIRENLEPDDSKTDEEHDAQVVEYNELHSDFTKWASRFDKANKTRKQSGIMGRKHLLNSIQTIIQTSVDDTVHKGNLLGMVARLRALEG